MDQVAEGDDPVEGHLGVLLRGPALLGPRDDDAVLRGQGEPEEDANTVEQLQQEAPRRAALAAAGGPPELLEGRHL
eukprot:9758402-Alexandrium_andersonii.AAC.1